MAKTAGRIHQMFHVKWNFGLLFMFVRWNTECYKKSSCCSGRRKKTEGRVKLRWEDGVMEGGVMEGGVTEDGVTEDGVTEDARKLGERNWRNAARNRGSWQKLLKTASAQKGLLYQ